MGSAGVGINRFCRRQEDAFVRFARQDIADDWLLPVLKHTYDNLEQLAIRTAVNMTPS
jgi:hypothetical protein